MSFEVVGRLTEVLEELNRFEGSSDVSATEGRVTILRNFTVEGISPFLKLNLYRSSVLPVIQFGGFDTVMQDLLTIASERSPFPDVLGIALVLENLDPAFNLAGWTADLALKRLATIQQAALEVDSLIAINTFLPPLYPDNPLDACIDNGSISHQVERLNAASREFVRRHSGKVFLCDFDRYMRRTGEAGLDSRYWYLSRAPFKPEFLACWAADLATIVRALKGKTKKCLVLDCDNTLWGGVLGEDGFDGIRLDPFEYPGRAYYDFQAAVTRLTDNGVMVTLCSKNNETDVLEVLDTHEHCLLKRSHLVGWKINWRDKATNLLELAKELNIGLDAMVFVDDNPAECALIQEQLADVTVLAVPHKLHEYPLLISRSQLFAALTVSAEDRMRTAVYQQERDRQSEREIFVDMEGYLTSLQMVAEIHPITAGEIPRVAQLTQKTNQFNLTSRRYSEVDISRFCTDNDHLVFSLSVSDRFGDLGMIGVLVVRYEKAAAVFDTCLMSCRALGRSLEVAFLYHAVESVRRAWPDVQLWRAEYIATAKNSQVADFWERNGFEKVTENSERSRYLRHGAAPWLTKPPFITITE